MKSEHGKSLNGCTPNQDTHETLKTCAQLDTTTISSRGMPCRYKPKKQNLKKTGLNTKSGSPDFDYSILVNILEASKLNLRNWYI